MKKVLLNLVFLFALVCFAEAQEFKVADIFSDNMVLQQKINNPFWGWGKPGTKVTISTSWNPDKEYTGVVNSKGTWKIAVPTPAAGGPYEVTVTANKKKVFQKCVCGRSMVGKRTVQHEYAVERILLPAGTGIYRGHIVFSKKANTFH